MVLKSGLIGSKNSFSTGQILKRPQTLSERFNSLSSYHRIPNHPKTSHRASHELSASNSDLFFGDSAEPCLTSNLRLRFCVAGENRGPHCGVFEALRACLASPCGDNCAERVRLILILILILILEFFIKKKFDFLFLWSVRGRRTAPVGKVRVRLRSHYCFYLFVFMLSCFRRDSSQINQ